MSDEVRFIDTTLRDGNQSLWALNMKTGAMLPALRRTWIEAGFESMEFFVSVMFKKYVREHKENPWDWVREGTKGFKKTRLRYHGGMHGAFEKTPHCILKLLIERLVSYGITLTRTSELLERLQRLQRRDRRAEEDRHGNGRQPDLLRLAAPYRRVLCAESPGSGGHQALSHLF